MNERYAPVKAHSHQSDLSTCYLLLVASFSVSSFIFSETAEGLGFANKNMNNGGM